GAEEAAVRLEHIERREFTPQAHRAILPRRGQRVRLTLARWRRWKLACRPVPLHPDAVLFIDTQVAERGLHGRRSVFCSWTVGRDYLAICAFAVHSTGRLLRLVSGRCFPLRLLSTCQRNWFVLALNDQPRLTRP